MKRQAGRAQQTHTAVWTCGNSPGSVLGAVAPVTRGQTKPDISKSFFGKGEPTSPPGLVSHRDMID